VNSCKTTALTWFYFQTSKTSRKFLYSKFSYLSPKKFLSLKVGTALAVRKGIPHNQVDLPPPVSVEATEPCVPIGSSEILLVLLYKLPGCVWSDADIMLLSFRS